MSQIYAKFARFARSNKHQRNATQKYQRRFLQRSCFNWLASLLLSFLVFNPYSAHAQMGAVNIQVKSGDVDIVVTCDPVYWNGNPVLCMLLRSTSSNGAYSTIGQMMTNSSGQYAYTDTNVVYGQGYYYKIRAVYPYPINSMDSNPAIYATLKPPAAPGIPTFSGLQQNSVSVLARFGLPARTTSLSLEQAQVVSGVTQPYSVVATSVIGNSSVQISSLSPGTTYVFRWVSIGHRANTPGWPAQITTPAPGATWLSGYPITCAGIRWPASGSTIKVGARGRLSSFLATDWDVKQTTLNNTTTLTVCSDPCRYQWSADGGVFEDGNNMGQSVVWIAPSSPGTYTIGLTVDDQSGFNKSGSETGDRNDSTQGYNDAPQKFSITITVVP